MMIMRVLDWGWACIPTRWFLPIFPSGGYATYAFKAEILNYGYNLQLFPSWQSDNKFMIRVRNGLDEMGGYNFLDENRLKLDEQIRYLLVDRMFA